MTRKRLLLPTFLAVLCAGVLGSHLWLSAETAKPDDDETDEKPTYIGSAKCKLCHGDEYKTWIDTTHGRKLEDARLPEDRRGCEGCHGPGSLHMATTGNKEKIRNPASLEPAESTKICGGCHFQSDSSSAPAAWQKLSERQWDKGEHQRGGLSCLKCHEVHSASAQYLRKPVRELCTECHGNLISEGGEYTHSPVASGKCSLCHEPHGAGLRHLARPGLPTVCGNCHNAEEVAFKTAHKGYPVAGRDCLSCHNPHAANREEKLIREFEHKPFEEGKCDRCHEGPDAADPLKTKQTGAELCFGCHPKDELLAAKDEDGKDLHTHFPVEKSFCQGCHNPHASDSGEGQLLKDDANNVCFTCHASVESACYARYRHKPVESGECLTCHQPHQAAEKPLLRKPQIQICESCHPKEMKHVHPLNVKGKTTGQLVLCVSCHDIHGGPFEYITKADRSRDLCIRCHEVGK